jgi:outer membrane protein
MNRSSSSPSAQTFDRGRSSVGRCRAALLAGALGAALLGSQGTAAEIKIGFVNAERLLEDAPQAEASRKALEREFAPRDRKIVREQKKILSLEDKLNRDGPVMSESELKRTEREIRNMKREIKRSQDEFREDFNIRRNEELTKLQKDIFDAIRELAKDKKYDLILSDGVISASSRIDITDEVLKRLKRKFR